jgi:glyoxylase-like metal-dependent hydrolase (beta-lactamase superfamily II)
MPAHTIVVQDDVQWPGKERAVHQNDVVAVRFGRLLTTRSYVFLDHESHGLPDEPFELAYYFWLVRSPDGPVLVDTGFDRDVGLRRGREVVVDPCAAFAALGLEPTKPIDIVVTHAHYDHIGNLRHFTDATVHMSGSEYDFWTVHDEATTGLFAHLVEADEIAHLRDLRTDGRLRLLDEPTQIRPGVEIFAAPGHTPGQLAVAVDTPQGRVVLASDAVHVDEELRHRRPFTSMTDLATALDTYQRLDQLEGTTIIAGHEASVLDRFPMLPGTLAEHAVVIGGSAPPTALGVVEKHPHVTSSTTHEGAHHGGSQHP